MTNKFLQFLESSRQNKKIVLSDGGLGTEILKRGIDISNIPPELLNIQQSNVIADIHREYIKAGSNIITTNTFGANSYKLKSYGYETRVEEFCVRGIEIAKSVVKEFGLDDLFVVATIGPIGKLLEPLGELKLYEAYEIYKEVMQAFEKAKPDAIILETMLDIQEARIALLAAKDVTEIPVIVSMTFEGGKRTTTGTPPEVAAVVFESMGAAVVGANCSTGPDDMFELVEKMRAVVDIPIIIQANAGNPVDVDGKTVFPLLPASFAESIKKIIEKGADIVGGCCGTSPEHIGKVQAMVQSNPFSERSRREHGFGSAQPPVVSFLTSRTKLLTIQKYPIILGERINPNAQKKIAESIKSGNFANILDEAQTQVSKGAEILDINVSVPNVDESEIMKAVVKDIGGIVDVPVCIDSPDYLAIENGLKYFAGKALVNSVNGEDEKLRKILPIVKKYGAAVIALTMDEDGIPDTVDGRFKIAKKIVAECEKIGIKRQDIYIDALVLTISTNPLGAKITLDTIRRIKNELGTRTVLGLSNISFGLPGRPIINSNFLAMAIEAGLDVAITNPNNEILRNSFYASALLCGHDSGAEKYINSFYESDIREAKKAETVVLDLKEAIIRGFKDRAVELVCDELKTVDELEIINTKIIPALDVVGDRYEKGIYFLPQLLLSAETAQLVSKQIQQNMTQTGKKQIDNSGRTIVFATVKGDLHDIGKNIVISVLENYGYNVIDLGKGVAVDEIIKAALKNKAKVIALSALMTTTMTEMKKLIDKLTDQGLRDKFKVFIGGAVVNQDYADKIGADAYSKDAMDTVNCLRRFGI